MRVYISIAAGENPNQRALRSCREITRRKGDAVFEPEEVSHGHTTRGSFLLDFLGREKYDAWLLLDGDQVQPADLLERLRMTMWVSRLDMVCAHYYRRQTK